MTNDVSEPKERHFSVSLCTISTNADLVIILSSKMDQRLTRCIKNIVLVSGLSVS